MTAEFGAWLSRALQGRGWSIRQLARMVGVSHTTVTNVANGRTPPSPELCRDLARVFSMAAEDVFRLADLLPARPRRVVYDDEGTALLDLWRTLLPADQERVFDLARRLAEPRIIGEP